MRKAALQVVVLAFLMGVCSATACTDVAPANGDADGYGSSSSGDASSTSVGLLPDGGREASASPPPVRAEFGLDARPINATCLAPAKPPVAGPVKLERVFANVNLQATMMMGQPPGDKTRWFAASRTGRVVSFPVVNPPAEPAVVADVAALAKQPVEAVLEGGFLGFAFHPKFAENGRLYITFSTTDAAGKASEVAYLTSTDGGVSFTSYTRVLAFARTRFEHNGGGIAFDREGMLLLGFGDMANDTNGQRIPGFSARLLRIDVDHPEGGKPYGIPAGNPFKNGGAEPPEVYAKGLRNPFRISVDRSTGDIWVGDVGQDTYEEVNRVEAGGNYGWPCREGAHDYKADDAWLCPSKVGLIDPVLEHKHVIGGRAVIGGVVYRGLAMPAFHNTYVYGDFIKGEVMAASLEGAGPVTPVQLNESGPSPAVTHFAEDADGEIYVSTLLQNEIYKLVPSTPGAPSTFPDHLSKTGCVDPAHPTKPAPGVIPYGVNAALWSDGAAKERTLALPEGKTIVVGADGDFDLPIGSVLTKTFSLGDKRVETRLFARHDDGDWAGYTYEWNDEQTDAVLLYSAKTKTVGAQTWSFPSRSECLGCHTAAAGRTLGVELGQLNGEYVYPTTNRASNQLKTFEHIGLLSAPLGKPVEEISAYPDPFGAAPLEARARAYLHGNCSNCHVPNGGGGRAPMDFRFATSFADTNTCGVASVVGDLGVVDAKILSPGKPESSLISVRTHATDKNRMPPLGSRVVDEQGVKLLDDWIRAATCP